MNKREWRKCYKDLRDEIDRVRRECAKQLEGARREKDNANFWHRRYESIDRASTEAWDKMLIERDTALNKVEELRRDAVRLATELARVQGLCDAGEEERRNLLAWQRRVREGWKECDECTGYNTRLRQAIEAETTFDFTAYMRQVEYWGQTHDDKAEPKGGSKC